MCIRDRAYIDQFGTADFAGFVFVDNDAGGRAPGGADQDFGLLKGLLEDRQKATNGFVRNLNFKKPQAEEYLQKVIQASLRVPTNTAVTLLVGYFVADYRSVLPKIDKPSIVCASKTPYMGTIVEMQKQMQGSQLEVFDGDGHALFVDDADKFNSLLEEFLLDLRYEPGNRGLRCGSASVTQLIGHDAVTPGQRFCPSARKQPDVPKSDLLHADRRQRLHVFGTRCNRETKLLNCPRFNRKTAMQWHA